MVNPCKGIRRRRCAGCAIFAVIFCMAFAVLCAAADAGIDFTDEELEFINTHPVIRIGVDPEFVPYEFIDENGEHKGISADYLAKIAERTGLQFEIVKGLSWVEVYDMALAGEIDVLPAIGKTVEREEKFLFSDPYYHYKRVIVTREKDASISGMDDLFGLTVAVQRYSSHHSYMLSYPKINLSLYDTAEAALTAVATGEEKAFIGNLATANYIIRSNGLTNLRLVSFEAEKQHALHFAVRKDRPQLLGIINKALASIGESERFEINNKWVDLQTDIDYRPVIRILAVVGITVAAILAVSIFWIARLRDEINHRKQIQLDLEQAKKQADEANEFKSHFMARMSHEIRTPLNAITGLSYLLKKTDVSLTQRMYVDRIIQSANNMLSIINDILDFSKIEAGKVELELTSFAMDQVIQDVVNIILYKIDEQGIGFRLSKDPLVPNRFFGDPKRIEQILLNLLSNSVKFTDAGEVSLDVRLLAKEGDKYHISFTVSDTGIGMTEEQVKKLFSPFEQGDSSINRRYGGSGLGLSIVKNLVDMMGGEIKVFSTPGEGSTFIINLSLDVDAEKESVYAKVLSCKHFKNMRTLILEKSGANINLIESYLGSHGMYCELTSSEDSAVCVLEAADGRFAKPFDLFIIDYETPAEGGLAFVEKLRTNEKIARLPKIIMLFPMMRYDLFDKLADYGIDMGIGKPIIPSILLNGILDIFNLKAVSDSKSSANGKHFAEKLEKQYCVLLAEDNKSNQLIAKTLLEQVGITTLVAGDGNEAVELYQQHKESIDLILMDLHMPGKNGYESAQEIRAVSTDVPIVAMTADVIYGVREKCENIGIHHYISKPFNPDYFIETVKSIILSRDTGGGTAMPVLDRKKGLENTGGGKELYNKVLLEYYGENLDTADRLAAAVREKRYDDAAQIVHKVKSSSASIGAKTLAETAASLQSALAEKDESEILTLCERFSDILGKLLAEIEKTKENQN